MTDANRRWALAGLLLAGLAGATARADVTKFEVLAVEHAALEGRLFGDVGSYERIRARATVSIDPNDRRNAQIADIGIAPRNAKGLVEAVSDVEILRPTDPKKGNGKLLYEVVNRGNKQAPGIFNEALTKALATAADAGNGYLMRRGYTLVWSGWQGDIKSSPSTLALAVPVLNDVTGRITAEIVFDNLTNPGTAPLSWPIVDPASAKLTVRARWDDSPAIPAEMSFRFVDPTHVEIRRPAGFDGGAIYQLDYTAGQPLVLGLGFAATRDIVAYLRRDRGVDNPLAADPPYKQAYAYGQSQSGRFLREFLYLGFNEDAKHQRVFDGVLTHVSGARFTAVNQRFGIPERAPRHPQDPASIADRFPFTYTETTDPITKARDGLLKRCSQSHTCPKIIQADSEYEWYNSKESLLVTDPSGRQLKMPANVRLFTIAGTPHLAQPDAVAQTNPLCVLPVNPLHHGPVMRAMLDNLDAWVDRNVTPPQSRIPGLNDDSLAAAETAQLPAPIPGLPYTSMHVVAAAEDLSVHPSKLLGEYTLLLPKLNADGMILGGIHLPVIDAPKGTYTGWNPRTANDGPTTLCPLMGGALAFAATRDERAQHGDPRLSLEERYPSAEAYVAKVDALAQALVRQRLLLLEDLPRQHQAALDDTLAKLRPKPPKTPRIGSPETLPRN